MSLDPRRIRRILVALDASADSLAGLDAAARLAADLRAELLGVFVEETDLLRAGELPSSREVSLFGGEPRRIDREELEREIRAMGRRARQALEAAAERERISWSFRILRGRPARELAGAAEEVDLVAVGATGRSPWRAPGSTVLELVRDVRRPVLVLRQGLRPGPAVQAMHDGTPSGREAVRTGAALCVGEDARLRVLLTVEGEAEARDLRAGLEERLSDAPFAVTFRHLPGAGVAGVCAAMADADGGLLVAPGPPFGTDREALGRLLRSAGCPVVLVSGEEPAEAG